MIETPTRASDAIDARYARVVHDEAARLLRYSVDVACGRTEIAAPAREGVVLDALAGGAA